MTLPTRPGFRPASSTKKEIVERIKYGHSIVRSWQQWRETVTSVPTEEIVDDYGDKERD